MPASTDSVSATSSSHLSSTSSFHAERLRIHQAFLLYAHDNGETCLLATLPAILRTLHLFPSEHELITHILPLAIQQQNGPQLSSSSSDSTSSSSKDVIELINNNQLLTYSTVENVLLRYVVEGLYQSPTSEELRQAFYVLDNGSSGTVGYIHLQTLKNALVQSSSSSSSSNEYGLNESEWKDMATVCEEEDSALVNYEDYISLGLP